MSSERKLTKAEEKRADRFEEEAQRLKAEGYEETQCTVDILKANLLAVVVMIPFVLLIAIPYLMLHGVGKITSLSSYLLSLALFIFIIMAEFALHEGIHGLTWGLLNKEGFSAIEFGFIREYATPYCYCGTTLGKGQYIIGSVMPTLVLGFLQGLLAILTGNFLILALAVVMMFGGGGDFLITGKLLAYRQKKQILLVQDHPTELGFVAFEKD